MLILLLLLLLLLLLIQGQHCWRSRSPSATEPTRCTIGPATARRWATALGAACYATTSPSLFGRCKKFPVAKLLSSIACSDVRFLTPFLYTMQQPLGAQSRGWNLTSYWEPETCCLNVWWCIVHILLWWCIIRWTVIDIFPLNVGLCLEIWSRMDFPGRSLMRLAIVRCLKLCEWVPVLDMPFSFFF